MVFETESLLAVRINGFLLLATSKLLLVTSPLDELFGKMIFAGVFVKTLMPVVFLLSMVAQEQSRKSKRSAYKK
jgi:hypothetical protein